MQMTVQFKYKMKAVFRVDQFLPGEIVTQTHIWCFEASVWGTLSLYNCVQISRSCIFCNILSVKWSICVCLYTCAFHLSVSESQCLLVTVSM